jgi:excisionase family DNA binding protein
MELKLKILGLISVQDAAKELGVPRSTIHRWVDGNKMVGINIDGILNIPTSEVEKRKKELEKEPAESLTTPEIVDLELKLGSEKENKI